MAGTETIVNRALLDLVEATNDAIVVTSADDLDRPGPLIIYANPAFCRISGYSPEEIIGKSPRILQGPGTSQKALHRISLALREGSECQEELLNYSRDGTPYWLDIHIVPLRDETGTIRYFGAIERDVTNKRNATERLKKLALEDVLTGIGNRAALERHIEGLSETPNSTVETLFMLLFDLDGFKDVNDSLGHIAGDQILQHFAGYLASSLHRDDFLARLGGDEFVAVLKGYTPDSARHFAENVVKNLSLTNVKGIEQISVSVGMTSFLPSETMKQVLQAADIALYSAKEAGKGRVHIYHQIANRRGKPNHHRNIASRCGARSSGR
ncbi:sensor domain-containing diguanylate cyclase [Maritalea mediterranea]|uniref:Diguanylate cyclase n=1 Tax=Maritalea mediterranea TaxID=2909667 RepID=A0ABS9EAA6_9HYPH|nr:diguanylate cyclase [Maritalea mediterranea]MCF4098358.1 diguanylate cyclase [Maritalea mediterranea]